MSDSNAKRHYMGRESIPVTHHFTPDELRGFAQEMSHAQEEAENLATEKKHVADSYKERIDKETARVSTAKGRKRSTSTATGWPTTRPVKSCGLIRIPGKLCSAVA